MKRIIFLLLAVFILQHLSFAKKVSLETVKKIAVKVFMDNYSGRDKNEILIDKTIPFTRENDTLFYVLNFKQNGFVIISADNSAPPVLGYCLGNKFDSLNIPPGLDYLLSKYKVGVYTIRKEHIEPTLEIKNKWEQLLDDKTAVTKSILNEVIPLCNTIWSQWSGYNMYCPVDNGSHVPAGCVAVAMAQVLYFWQCRVEGTGQHSYQSDYGTLSADFENANYKWYAMDTIAPDQDNALLIYHCGVSTDMDYGPDGSGTTIHKAAVALRTYFGFPDKTKKILRIDHPFDWKNILIGNLNRGLPIIYGANETIAPWSPGHAWVIDGYNINEEFYCNWGWAGDYNGYDELGNFCTPNGCFNQYEVAITEIEPMNHRCIYAGIISGNVYL